MKDDRARHSTDPWKGTSVKVATGASRYAAAVFLITLTGAQADPVTPPPGIPVEQFVALYCAGCHGPAGQGLNPVFPKLTGQRPDYLFREMQKFRSGARKGTMMQVYLGNLQDRDLAILARYFSGLHRVPDAGDGAPPDEAGRRLHMEGDSARGLPACASCHVSGAQASHHVTPMPRLTGQHAAYLENQMDRFLASTRDPGQTPSHPIVDRLEDDEIRSVSRYLSRIE
jgi:cytochrome c553